MEKQTRKQCSRAQIIEINDALREALVKHDDGSVSYKGDASDESIAAKLGGGITKHNVAGARKELYGALRQVAQPEKLQQLAERVEKLEKALHTLADLHAKLCLGLSVGRVMDVRHLSGQSGGPATPQGGK